MKIGEDLQEHKVHSSKGMLPDRFPPDIGQHENYQQLNTTSTYPHVDVEEKSQHQQLRHVEFMLSRS
jgi:hypothetical protein